jgi:hypothetical protein
MIPMFSARHSFRRRLHDRRRDGITTAFMPGIGRRFRGYSTSGPRTRRFGAGIRLYQGAT